MKKQTSDLSDHVDLNKACVVRRPGYNDILVQPSGFWEMINAYDAKFYQIVPNHMDLQAVIAIMKWGHN